MTTNQNAETTSQVGIRAKKLLFVVLLFVSLSIVTAIVMGARIGKPVYYFGEHEFITWISTAQLLAIAWFSYKIFQVDWPSGYSFKDAWQSPAVVWFIVAVGFVYLACDEYFLFHENIDRWIHRIFGIKETGWTDRMDDLLIGLYGIIGIIVLYICRREIMKYRKMMPYIVSGFILLFLMVVLDTGTDRADILSTIVRADWVDAILMVLSIAEDSVKVLSESLFLVGFYGAFQLAKVRTRDTYCSII